MSWRSTRSAPMIRSAPMTGSTRWPEPVPDGSNSRLPSITCSMSESDDRTAARAVAGASGTMKRLAAFEGCTSNAQHSLGTRWLSSSSTR